MSFKIQTRPNPIFKSMDDFSLNKVLGTGAFAVVYEACHLTTGNKYAIKRIDFSRISSLDRENVEKELEVHVNLEHPFVVRMVDFLLEANVLYMILELCTNGNLYRLMNRSRLRLYDIKKFFRQTCLAIQYLHGLNIVMRDLKPENIILDNKSCIKMCDFGWAAKEDDFEYCKITAGTYAYMSPESLQEKLQAKSSDIWSLGVLLYELYYNKEPFPGENSEEIMKLITKNQIKFEPEIDIEGKELILALLKIDPNQRPLIQQILDDKFFKSLMEMGFVDPDSQMKKNLVEFEWAPDQKLENGESQTQKTANTSVNDPQVSSLGEVKCDKDEKGGVKDDTEKNNTIDEQKNEINRENKERKSRNTNLQSQRGSIEHAKTNSKTELKNQSLTARTLKVRIDLTPRSKLIEPQSGLLVRSDPPAPTDLRRSSTPINFSNLKVWNQYHVWSSPPPQQIINSQNEDKKTIPISMQQFLERKTELENPAGPKFKPIASVLPSQIRSSDSLRLGTGIQSAQNTNKFHYLPNGSHSKKTEITSPKSVHLTHGKTEQFEDTYRIAVHVPLEQLNGSKVAHQTTQGFNSNKIHVLSQTHLVAKGKRYEIRIADKNKPYLDRDRSVDLTQATQPSQPFASMETSLNACFQNFNFLDTNKIEFATRKSKFLIANETPYFPLQSRMPNESKPVLEHNMLEKPKILVEPNGRTIKLSSQFNNQTLNTVPVSMPAPSLSPSSDNIVDDGNPTKCDKNPSRQRVVYKLDKNNQYSKSSRLFDLAQK